MKAEGKNYLCVLFCFFCWSCSVFSSTRKRRETKFSGSEKDERGKHFNAYENLFSFSIRHQNEKTISLEFVWWGGVVFCCCFVCAVVLVFVCLFLITDLNQSSFDSKLFWSFFSV